MNSIARRMHSIADRMHPITPSNSCDSASHESRLEYTEKEWNRLMQFIEDNGLYYLNISPLTSLPGTVIWDEHQDTVPRRAHGL